MNKKGGPSHCQDCPSFGEGIFCELKAHALDGVSEHKVTNNYKKGQTLFMQGTPPFGLFCISSGNIKLVKSDASGKDSIIRIAKPGDILGHRSLFSDQNYQATAVALEDTTVCFLDRKYIHELVNHEPTVAFNLITKLSSSLGLSEDKLASLSSKSVRERVAEFLLLLKSTHGKKTDDGTIIDLKLTREEMASAVGTATETLIRFISELKDEKIIRNDGKKIIILDSERLAEFANLDFY